MTTVSAAAPTISPSAPKRHNGRLALLSVVLLLLGLTVGFVAGRVTAPETVLPADLAGPEVVTMLQNHMDAVNVGDAATLESLFAEDATSTDTTKSDGYVIEGNTQIAQAMASWSILGFRLSDPGTAILNGDYVAQYHLSSSGPAVGVYQLNGDGRIQNLWVVRP